jgi:hypothetical protein
MAYMMLWLGFSLIVKPDIIWSMIASSVVTDYIGGTTLGVIFLVMAGVKISSYSFLLPNLKIFVDVIVTMFWTFLATASFIAMDGISFPAVAYSALAQVSACFALQTAVRGM